MYGEQKWRIHGTRMRPHQQRVHTDKSMRCLSNNASSAVGSILDDHAIPWHSLEHRRVRHKLDSRSCEASSRSCAGQTSPEMSTTRHQRHSLDVGQHLHGVLWEDGAYQWAHPHGVPPNVFYSQQKTSGLPCRIHRGSSAMPWFQRIHQLLPFRPPNVVRKLIQDGVRE